MTAALDFMYPELTVGLVEPGTDDATCERCNRQALVYVLDPEQYQHFACLDCCGRVTAGLIRDNPQKLRPEMASSDTETVATYEQGGRTFQIDHLGIGHPNQWGWFAVYADGEHYAEFCVVASWFKPEHRPPLPTTDTLIQLAKATVREVEQDEESEHAGLPMLDLGLPDRETRDRWNACSHATGAHVVASIGNPGARNPDSRGLPWDVLPSRPDALAELDGIRVTVSLGVCADCGAPVLGVTLADHHRWTPEHGPAWRVGYVRPVRDGEPKPLPDRLPTPTEALIGPVEPAPAIPGADIVDLDHRTFVDTMRRLDKLIVVAHGNLNNHGLATGFRVTTQEFEQALDEAEGSAPTARVLALSCLRLAQMQPR